MGRSSGRPSSINFSINFCFLSNIDDTILHASFIVVLEHITIFLFTLDIKEFTQSKESFLSIFGFLMLFNYEFPNSLNKNFIIAIIFSLIDVFVASNSSLIDSVAFSAASWKAFSSSLYCSRFFSL